MVRKLCLKWIIPFIFISSFLLVFTACRANNDEENNRNNNDPSHSSASREIEHAMGTTIVPENPNRVVILTNEGTEALIALGVTPLGAVRSWTGDPWYPHLTEAMDDVQIVGTENEPNLETIAALEPDLIIGNKMRQEEIYEQLNSIAPTVFSEALLGDWKINFELYAKALNLEEEGQHVLEEYEQDIHAFRENLGDELNLEISVVRFLGGDVRIYQKDSFSGVILDEIGFARPPSQDVDEFALIGVTKEMIPEMNGDILIYFTYETGDGEGSKVEEEWLRDPLFKSLPVVSRGDIYKVSDDVWNTAGGVLAAKLLIEDLENIIGARHSLGN